jgi:outer membrane protein assembly factor BamB
MNSFLPFLALLLAPSLAGADNDWPRFRGPNGDNSVAEAEIATTFPASGPKVLWSIDVNAGYGGSAIVGDEVFFMDRVDQEKDVVLCVGLADGQERWKWEREVPGRISHPGSRVVPTATADAIYASSGFGHVYCIDRKTHKERWVVDVMKAFESEAPRFGYSVHPVIHGDLCIIAPSGGSVGLAALDKKSGKTVWKTGSVGGTHSSPVLVKVLGREIVMMPGTEDGVLWLTGFDPKDGKQLFRYAEKLPPGRFNPIPNVTVVDEDTVYFTGGYGFGTRVLDLAKADGAITVKMTAKIDDGATLHPVLNIGKFYFVSSGRGSGGGRSRGGARSGGGASGLVCLDEAGKLLWKTGKEPDVAGGSIINAGGILLIQSGGDGSLRLIKPGDSYQELAVGKVFDKDPGSEIWAPMALSGDKLVMRSQAQVVCVDLGSR